MPVETSVTFHGLDPSQALRTHVLKHALRLERFAEDIRKCDIVVEFAERRHRRGNHFNVHGHVAMRGRRIDAGSAPAADTRNTDPYVAVSDVFDSLRRRVEDYVRRRRNETKART